MHRKTMTRADLVAAICRDVRLTRAAAADLVGQILIEISNCLARGENVYLASFGSFLLRDKKLRIGRNPKTGAPALIPPRRILRFKPSQKLTQRINAKQGVLCAGGSTSSGHDGNADETAW